MDHIKLDLGIDETLKICSERLVALSSLGFITTDSIFPIVNALLGVLESEITKHITTLRDDLTRSRAREDALRKEYAAYRVRNPETNAPF